MHETNQLFPSAVPFLHFTSAFPILGADRSYNQLRIPWAPNLQFSERYFR